jgi:hypothetical protein
VTATRLEAGRDFGPTLPQLLGPRLRALRPWQRGVLVLALLALVAAAAALAVRSASAVHTYKQSAKDASARGLAPIPFHFDYSSKMKKRPPGDGYVVVERSVGGTLAGRFTVSELELDSRLARGLVAGFMPIVATRHEEQAARNYTGFRLAFEGRARVNEVEGYQFAFSAKLVQPGKTARQLFGRIVLLPEPYDLNDPEKPYPAGERPTRGLVITMLATTLDHIPSPTRVGDEGILQRPFRSFRFGSG